MFDLDRTIKLVTGALFDAERTWQDYLPEAGDWKKTAFLLTGPLIILSSVLAYLGGFLAPANSMVGMFRPTLLSTIGQILMGAISAGVFSFVLAAFAGAYGGKNNVANGLAAMTLAFVPGYIGQAFFWLPWVGGLLALGLGIYSLVRLWKIIPVYLDVPANKRALHYFVSLVVTIIVMVIVSRLFAPMMPAPPMDGRFAPATSSIVEPGRVMTTATGHYRVT